MKDASFVIVYTDDDADDRALFTHAAQRVSEALQVVTMKDGDELIAFLNNASSSPDIILLDLNMPKKNGYEILQQLKESELAEDIPVVIFSTSDDEKSINTTQRLGASLYIPKPLSYKALKTVIKHILSINWNTFTPSPAEFVYRAN